MLVAAIPWVPIDARTQLQAGWCAHIAGNLAYMDSDWVEAEARYAEAVTYDSDDLSAHHWLARTVARRGDRQAAIDHVRIILDAFPDHFPTLTYMASLLHQDNQRDAAADHLVAAYRVPGNRTHTGVQAVKALVAVGRIDEARALVDADPKLSRHSKLKGVFGTSQSR